MTKMVLYRLVVPNVYVLGAGFSRAISASMPLLAELTNELLKREPRHLQDLRTSRLKDDVESILTFLATPQPWLDRSEQLANHGHFRALTLTIAQLIRERQNEALASPPPAWLSVLVNHWGSERAIVITLNYDTLVEKAVCDGQPSGSHSAGFESLYAVPVTPLHRRGPVLYVSGNRVDLFTLLRPHGCIQWLYSGQDSFYGEPVYLLPANPKWEPDGPSPYHDKGLDKTPLIVPPSLVKTGFFNSEFVEAQWKQAATALDAAETVTFLGYSLPTTDTTFRHLLATKVSESASIAVVNPSPDIGARYEDLFPNRVDARFIGVHDPIRSFAEALDANRAPA